MNALFSFLIGLVSSSTPEPLQTATPSIDRGEVKAGTILAHKFTFRNIGATTITIADVEAGCGCVKPRLSTAVLESGTSADLNFEVNTLSQPVGPNSWKVTVHYVDQSDASRTVRKLELVQKAKIVREIQVEPVALHLSIDREASHRIVITDRRPKPLTISEARCSSKHVTTQLTAVGVNAKGERIQQVHVTIADSCPVGLHQEVVQLLTDDPAYREIRVPLTISRKAPGQVVPSPEQVTFRLADGQNIASGLIRLRDPADQTVIVEKLEADHPAVRMKWAAGPGNMATLRLGVELTNDRSSGLGSVRVHIKDPKPQILVIPVVWQVP